MTPILVPIDVRDLQSIQAAGTGGRCPACCGGGTSRYRRPLPMHKRGCWLAAAIEKGRQEDEARDGDR